MRDAYELSGNLGLPICEKLFYPRIIGAKKFWGHHVRPPHLTPHLTITCPSVPCFLPHFGAMSDQQREQNNQLGPQQPNGQMVPSPPVRAILHVMAVLVHLAYNIGMDRIAALYDCTPYHTSALSGEGWVYELLSGHSERIRNELGVYRSTFLVLVEVMKLSGLQSSRHVSIEEQLSIFLYTAVTGLGCTHVGARFQWSSSTITK